MNSSKGINPDFLKELFLSYYEARKNKRNTINQLRFEESLELELVELARLVENREYHPLRSIAFVVEKPVKREIFAANFRDRVIHHLIFRQIAPLFDDMFIYDSYACRKNKGTLFGVERLEHHIRSCSENYTKACYVLKLDIKGYFMSMDKHILYKELETVLKRKWKRYCHTTKHCEYYLDLETLLYLIRQTVFNDTIDKCTIKGKLSDWDDLPKSKSLFHVEADKGLPIGNLTSQLFSNIYMNIFDRWIKRELRIKYYGRYVDDFFILGRCRVQLKQLIPEIKKYLITYLKLELHPNKIYLQDSVNGVPFLGMIIKPYVRFTGHRTVRNFNRRLSDFSQIPGIEKFEDVPPVVNSYLGIMSHTRSLRLRRKIIHKNKWIFSNGLIDNRYTKYRLEKNQ